MTRYGSPMDTGKLSDQASTGTAAGPDVSTPLLAEAASPARLVFASFLMLFVELALIRWVTSNNVFITNTTNFVLLASFLGIGDRKSTRLNSSHLVISYAVFCLKKKKQLSYPVLPGFDPTDARS